MTASLYMCKECLIKQFYTEEQRKDYIRCNDISAGGTVFCDNDTKWSEAIQVLSAIPNFAARFWVKLVREVAPAPGPWEWFLR